MYARDEAAPEKGQAQRWGTRCHGAVRFYRLSTLSEPPIARVRLSGLRRGLNGRLGGLNGRAAQALDGLSYAHRRIKDPSHRNQPLVAMPSDRFEARRRHAAAVAA